MISPFESEQVRTDPHGNKIVSYGTSSYGYDVRCSNEFKIFTNVYSQTIDPKNFNDKSFVDVIGDCCIIPPNSFALARTVEYFKIPRSTLVVCLGKSTYARCFSGDTQVALSNGTSVSLMEMSARYRKGERFFGYGMSNKLGVVVTEFKDPRKVNSNERLLEVTLDNGDTIKCTPDHKFLIREGLYVEAKDLKSNMSLMTLHRYECRGREVVYHPSLKNCEEYYGEGVLPNNHKVASVKKLMGKHDVYCLTVPETGNFALEAGVFVKNCGIIVNVTPLEPEWEGHVTLEFSNTTPLPAKIYANEGVAQMLFFESDEECETSYLDRGGKYQGQTGVTLPKT